MARGRPVSKRNKSLRFQDIETERDRRGWSYEQVAAEVSRLLKGRLRGDLTFQEVGKYQNWRTDPPATVLAAMGAALGLKEVRLPCDPKEVEATIRKLVAQRKKKSQDQVMAAAEKPGRYELARNK